MSRRQWVRDRDGLLWEVFIDPKGGILLQGKSGARQWVSAREQLAAEIDAELWWGRDE